MIYSLLIFTLFFLSCGKGNVPSELTLKSSQIVGVDNRVVVQNTKIYPYKLVGKITGLNSGTGAYVAPNVVLTAAHVARSYIANFNPGYQNFKKPFGSYDIEKIIYPKVYLENNCLKEETVENKSICYANDFAFLILKGGLPKGSKTFKIIPFTKNDEMKKVLTSIGYGADTSRLQKVQNELCKGYAVIVQKGNIDVFMANIDLGPYPNFFPVIINDCDAKHGDSGSPLFKKNGDEYQIVGVQVSIGSDEMNPSWESLDSKFGNEDWQRDTYATGTAAVAGQSILLEIKNNPELSKLIETDLL